MPGLCDLPDEVILLTLNCGPWRPADFAAVALSCRRLKPVAEDVLYAENRDLERSSAVDWAARHGNTATMDKALNHGLSIEPIDEGSPTSRFNPFQTAVEQGQDSAVTWFLDHGADITRRIRPRCHCRIDKTCILHSAFCSRKASTALLLVSGGAPLEYVSCSQGGRHGVTALQEASLFGLDTVVESLVRDHNMNQVFIEDLDMHLPIGVQHALSWAAMVDGNVPTIRKLVHLGADVNWPYKEWGLNPLHVAIGNSNFAIANALLDLGIDIRPRTFDRNTEDGEDEELESDPGELIFSPLHETITSTIDDQTPLRAIYEFSLGARSSRTAWHSDRDYFMKRLIELGVDLDMEAYGDWENEFPFYKPLELAVAKENIKDVSMLIAAGATVSSEMLHIAWCGYEEDREDCMKVVKHLLKHGARLDEPVDSHDTTMLQILARESKMGIEVVSGLHGFLLLSSPTNLAPQHLNDVLAHALSDLDWSTSKVLHRHGARVSDEEVLFTIASSITEKLKSDSQDPLLDPEGWDYSPGIELRGSMELILDMGLSNEDQCLIFGDVLQKEHFALADLFLDRGIASKPEATQYLAAYLMLAASWGNVGVIKRLCHQAHHYLGPAHRLLIVYNSIIRNRREAVSFFMDHGITPLDCLSPDQSREAIQLRSDAPHSQNAREMRQTLRQGCSNPLNAPTWSRQQKKLHLGAVWHGIGMSDSSCLSPRMSPLQLAVRYGHMDMINDILEYIPQNVDVNVMCWNIHIPKVLKKANEIRTMIKKAADLASWSRKVRAKQME